MEQSWSTGTSLINGRGQLSSAEGGNTGTDNTMVFGGVELIQKNLPPMVLSCFSFIWTYNRR